MDTVLKASLHKGAVVLVKIWQRDKAGKRASVFLYALVKQQPIDKRRKPFLWKFGQIMGSYSSSFSKKTPIMYEYWSKLSFTMGN